MHNLDARFYWDTAKFFFAAVAGSSAAFYAVKAANGAASKAVAVAEMKVLAKAAGAGDAPGLSLDDDETPEV